MAHDLTELQHIAASAYDGIRAAFAAAGKDVSSEAFHMHLAGKCAEEGGEVLKAYQRATGWARSAGSWEDVDGELADTVISAFLLAHAEQRDLPAAIAAKLSLIFARGWKDPS